MNGYVATTLRSRFNRQSKGPTLLVMQRLHEVDLTGRLLRKPNRWNFALPSPSKGSVKA